jgi:hypothetical protein
MAGSIGEAISLFRAIDVDLVLLGDSISGESRERLAFLIRASGSRVPVVCITDSPVESDSFADAIIRNDSSELLQCTRELLAKRAGTTVPERSARLQCRLRKCAQDHPMTADKLWSSLTELTDRAMEAERWVLRA